MEPIILIAGMALLLTFVLYVCHPFFASRHSMQLPPAGANSRDLHERKDRLYATIKELEFDQQLGKLSAEDYRRLRGHLEREAMSIIQQLEELNGRSQATLQESIEREVVARRQEQPVPRMDRCPVCQAARRSGDSFCSQCGTRFETRKNSS